MTAPPPIRSWRCRDRVLSLGERPRVMGILNVTPDSFSDGGRYGDGGEALKHAAAMVAAGADIIDVGGESTRPGAEAVGADEERRRVIPVIEGIVDTLDVAVSIDTMKADVASAALAAGAHIVNDVSALAHDDALAGIAAETGCGVVLMHMRGTPRTMQDDPRYDDVVGEVCAYLAGRVAAAEAAGVAREAIAIDPGIGFGKTLRHNLALLAGLPALAAPGVAVLVGLSRKRFIGELSGAPVEARLPGSLAGAVCAALGGADILRVHDVAETVQALTVAEAIRSVR